MTTSAKIRSQKNVQKNMLDVEFQKKSEMMIWTGNESVT